MRLLRILGIVLGILLAGGFGFCGAMGIRMSSGFNGPGGFDLPMLIGLLWIAIAVVLVWLVWIGLKKELTTLRPPEQ
jgi:hypothetical protein